MHFCLVKQQKIMKIESQSAPGPFLESSDTQSDPRRSQGGPSRTKKGIYDEEYCHNFIIAFAFIPVCLITLKYL